MLIEFDENKRQRTLNERGLDFADANQIFDGVHMTGIDKRYDYGEVRYISIGYINARLIVVVWTYHPDEVHPTHRRIISMRKANEREINRFYAALR
ncbi:BrnT family toxin [Moraxella sp. ZJ142]|uniref:BrnT family toxin n=1 Tax=Moraxella marmotae TaxID=3344520 RepID=UPI0035D495EE